MYLLINPTYIFNTQRGIFMDKEAFNISLKGPGVTIEREISEEVAQQVALFILTGATHHPRHTEPLSLNDFLQQSNARRNPERFIAIAYFIKKYRNRISFDKNDLIDGFEEAGQKFPANFSRDFKAVKSSGWIAHKSGRPGTFYLTESGVSAVETKFSSNAPAKTPNDAHTEIETLMAEVQHKHGL